MNATQEVKKVELIIPSLYYRYKKTSDEDIVKYLKKIKIVKKEHKGVGSEFGYYPLNKASVKEMTEKLRGASLTFDITETEDKPIKGLVPYLEFPYLVKSSSRFFLKPDIGEIFDQIPFTELWSDKIKAICFLNEEQLLDGTEGEHFVMWATLLTNEK